METVTILLAFVSLSAGLLALRQRRYTIPVVRSWPRESLPLDVWVHPGMGVYMDDIAIALQWWNGQVSKAFHPEPTMLVSTHKPVDGVWIRPAEAGELSSGNEKATLARTYRFPSDVSKPLERVEIAFDRSVDPSDYFRLVVAHELGHALGFGHPKMPPTGELMASGYNRIGWKLGTIRRFP